MLDFDGPLRNSYYSWAILRPDRGGVMQHLGYELPRIPLPRISVNKPKLCPATCL